jgi:hypothetical protein
VSYSKPLHGILKPEALVNHYLSRAGLKQASLTVPITTYYPYDKDRMIVRALKKSF